MKKILELAVVVLLTAVIWADPPETAQVTPWRRLSAATRAKYSPSYYGVSETRPYGLTTGVGTIGVANVWVISPDLAEGTRITVQ